MIPLTITPNLDKAPWLEYKDKIPVLHTLTRIGRLPNGTHSGQSVVVVAIELPDGSVVAAQTTMANFKAAAQALISLDDVEQRTKRN